MHKIINNRLISLGIINLRNIKSVFDEESIDYWIDMGTFLGAARNGKIIPWDTDIDFGVMDGELAEESAAIEKIRNLGYSVDFDHLKRKIRIKKHFILDIYGIDIYFYERGSNFARRVWCLSITKLKYKWLSKLLTFFQAIDRYYFFKENHFSSKKLKINSIDKISEDIFSYNSFTTTFHHETNLGKKRFNKTLFLFFCPLIVVMPKFFINTLRNFSNKFKSSIRSDFYNTNSVSVPVSFFDNLGVINIHGMEFRCPKDIEGYAKHRYGDKWKIPTMKWTFNQDDFAIEGNKNRVQK